MPVETNFVPAPLFTIPYFVKGVNYGNVEINSSSLDSESSEEEKETLAYKVRAANKALVIVVVCAVVILVVLNFIAILATLQINEASSFELILSPTHYEGEDGQIVGTPCVFYPYTKHYPNSTQCSFDARYFCPSGYKCMETESSLQVGCFSTKVQCGATDFCENAMFELSDQSGHEAFVILPNNVNTAALIPQIIACVLTALSVIFIAVFVYGMIFEAKFVHDSTAARWCTLMLTLAFFTSGFSAVMLITGGSITYATSEDTSRVGYFGCVAGNMGELLTMQFSRTIWILMFPVLFSSFILFIYLFGVFVFPIQTIYYVIRWEHLKNYAPVNSLL